MPKALTILALSFLMSLSAGAEVGADPIGPTLAAATPGGVVRAYSASWQRFFGTPAPLPRDVDLPAELSREEAFARLWTLCEPALLPSEQGAALS
jgi:hypothetical protein